MSPMMTPGTRVCSASCTVTAPVRSMSLADTVATPPGTFSIGSSPPKGDILTNPASTLSGGTVEAGAAAGGVALVAGAVVTVCAGATGAAGAATAGFFFG